MKILHVNSTDIGGGASRAVFDLHKGLLKIGLDSQILVRQKYSGDDKVICQPAIIDRIIPRLRPKIERRLIKQYKQRTKTLYSANRSPFDGVVEIINRIDPDIVHLHWIGSGMIRIEDLAQINKPIVWSLHDMWPFTGGCHYDEECGRYAKECGMCPVLKSNKENDLSFSVFKRKARTYAKITNLYIIGLSNWLANSARSSKLFAKREVFYLPNPINLDTFNPLTQTIARKVLGIADNKCLVTFGAVNAIGDPRKGFHELVNALKKVRTNNIELIVFGANRPHDEPDYNFPIHYLGYLFDDLSLRVVYSAADLMVVPSLQEAFCLTAAEAMACATPVVAFGATGLLDIIDHKKNGYLARPYDPDDLAYGIDWTLNNLTKPDMYSKNTVKKIQDFFELNKVAHQYHLLYQKVLA